MEGGILGAAAGKTHREGQPYWYFNFFLPPACPADGSPWHQCLGAGTHQSWAKPGLQKPHDEVSPQVHSGNMLEGMPATLVQRWQMAPGKSRRTQ